MAGHMTTGCGMMTGTQIGQELMTMPGNRTVRVTGGFTSQTLTATNTTIESLKANRDL